MGSRFNILSYGEKVGKFRRYDSRELTLSNIALGLVGEAVELYAERKQPRIIDELGDILFYTSWLIDYWPLSSFVMDGITIPSMKVHGDITGFSAVGELLQNAGEISETIKKLVFNVRPVDVQDRHLAMLADDIVVAIQVIAIDYGSNIWDVAEMNYQKLSERFS